jgi:transposase
MQRRDAFGAFYADEAFAPLFSRRGQLGAAPACLALVTVMQFAEGLSDRQAANAVRGHIDWKYALGLELTDPGFDASVLSEFRTRLIDGKAEAQLFELMLGRFREAGLLRTRGQQRSDATQVLAAIQTLNRLECVGETLRHALNVLSIVVPDQLRAQVPSEWFDRYGRRFENYRLPPGKPERYELAETIGAGGFQLLRWIYAPATPAWVRQIPAVEVLRQVWLQQFYASEDTVRWRVADDLPPSSIMI